MVVQKTYSVSANIQITAFDVEESGERIVEVKRLGVAGSPFVKDAELTPVELEVLRGIVRGYDEGLE